MEGEKLREKTYARINWENDPSILTPLNAVNLNKVDYAVNEIDDRVISLDTTKAKEEEVLQMLKDVTYDTNTGVFVFTKKNGTTVTVDLNVEKIPVNFSMSESGIITMTNADGTTYTADIGYLIKTYAFEDTGDIAFTVTVDQDGNKTVKANIVDGSITEAKMRPQFLADIRTEANKAETAAIAAAASEGNAAASETAAESWAHGGTGTRPGEDVDNAKYWAMQARGVALNEWSGIANKPFETIGDNLTVDENGRLNAQAGGGGILPQLYITSEDDCTVTVTNGSETIIPDMVSMGLWHAELPEFGYWTIESTNASGTATYSLNVDTVKVYRVANMHFTATITVNYPSDAYCIISKGDELYYSDASGESIAVHSAGVWEVKVYYDEQTAKTKNVNITADGQSETVTINEFAKVVVGYPDELAGQTVTFTNGNKTYSKAAVGEVVFVVADLGEWTATIDTYTANVNVTEWKTYNISIETFGYKGWLESAPIIKSFSSLDEVLQDEVTLRTLFTKHASVDYLCEWIVADSTITEQILGTDLVAKWVNLRDYALDKLYEVAKASMDSLGKYGYGEWVLKDGVWGAKGLVPIMTSNSAPYGTTIGRTENSSHPQWHAFDGNDSTYYMRNNAGTSSYIGYNFVNPVAVKRATYTNADGANFSKNRKAILEYSLDNNTWNVASETYDVAPSGSVVLESNVNVYAPYWRIDTTDELSTSYHGSKNIQFYGRQLTVSVPKMDSNTAPWGEVIGSKTDTSSPTYKMFDGDDTTRGNMTDTGATSGLYAGYDFKNDVLVKSVKVLMGSSTNTVVKAQGLAESGVWEDISEEFTLTINTTVVKECNPSKPYQRYRLFQVSSASAITVGIFTLQFYALDYSEHTERKWIYDHGVEVEPISTYKSGSAIVEKRSDELYAYLGTTDGSWFNFHSTLIDFTRYKNERCVLGGELATNAVNYPWIGIASDENGSNILAYSYFNNIPFNTFIDVTNNNGQYYPMIAHNGTKYSKATIKEWWLE